MEDGARPERAGDEIELTVGGPAAGGGFVGRAPDGRVVFVRHAIARERVRARVTETAAHYLRADATEVLDPSPHRVAPACPHAGPGGCGGCDYQHIELGAQRRFKAERVRELLGAIAGVDRAVEVRPVPGDARGLAWRTRVGFALDGEGRAGFFRHRSHEVVAVRSCPLEAPGLAELAIGSRRWPGVRAIDVQVAPGDGRVVCLELATFGAGVPDGLDADLVVDGRVATGSGAVVHEVLGRRFRVGPGVFWQVHPGAAHALAEAVLGAVGEVDGRCVVDCYCGAGLFSALLARAVGPTGRIVGIERGARACADARHNTADLANVTIRHGAVAAGQLRALRPRPTALVLDPPRQGAGRAVMAALCTLAPELRRIVYVSCDPATFARDARVCLDAGWRIDTLDAYDCFPMTEHVELVASLAPTA